jgi:hypothetical protein
MNRRFRAVTFACTLVFLLAAALPLRAQAPAAGKAATATDFFMQYRKAFDAAKKIEDLLGFMSASRQAQVNATPSADRPKMFEMMKMMGTLTNIKVTKETPTPAGATLTVEALDSSNAKTRGTISIVKEGGVWKVDKEEWSS